MLHEYYQYVTWGGGVKFDSTIKVAILKIEQTDAGTVYNAYYSSSGLRIGGYKSTNYNVKTGDKVYVMPLVDRCYASNYESSKMNYYLLDKYKIYYFEVVNGSSSSQKKISFKDLDGNTFYTTEDRPVPSTNGAAIQLGNVWFQ